MHGTNVRRRLTGFAARVILVTVGLLLSALPASAQVPPFPQCPPVGLDTSCAILIVYNPDGSRVTLVDPSQPPYDGIEDTLIGVQNNSSASVSSLALSGPGIFGFDGDGLCSVFPRPSGCPYGPTGYEGRGSTTAVASTASCGGCGNTFTVFDADSGRVNFRVPIPPGGSAYFSLEGPTASFVQLTPATLTLSPLADTNDVDTQHTVTATVTDAQTNPVPNIVVRFSVTGSVNTTGSCTTNTSGQCSFTYTGPSLPGADRIHAFADTNNNGTQDVVPFEPFGDATKVWTPPLSTPLCEVDVTYGGWITANNGDRGSFGGNAKVDSQNNPQGQEEYQDHGPAQPMDVHSIDVLSVICTTSPPPKQASIFGTATIDGAGTYNYRIDVKDVDEPGKGADTYRIRLSTVPLYDSGEHTLQGGNIQIHQ